MKEKSPVRKINVYFHEDFLDILSDFEMMVQRDPNFVDTIPKRIRKQVLKSGIISHSIREMIRRYVVANRPHFTNQNETKDINI